MKTPEYWQEQHSKYVTPEDSALLHQFIAAIQSDAREGMVPREELRPTIEFLRFNRKRMIEYGMTVYGIEEELARLETLLGEKGGQ